MDWRGGGEARGQDLCPPFRMCQRGKGDHQRFPVCSVTIVVSCGASLFHVKGFPPVVDSCNGQWPYIQTDHQASCNHCLHLDTGEMSTLPSCLQEARTNMALGSSSACP